MDRRGKSNRIRSVTPCELRGGYLRCARGQSGQKEHEVTIKSIKTEETFAENLEQTQESAQQPTVVPRADLNAVHHLAQKLMAELDKVSDGDMVGEIVETALKL